jgi:TolA-binding protein
MRGQSLLETFPGSNEMSVIRNSTKKMKVCCVAAIVIGIFMTCPLFAQDVPPAETDPKADNDRVYYENGLSLYKMKNYDKALLLFGEYLELYPEGAFRKDALRNMGDIYLSRFDYQKALKYYQYLYQEYNSEEEGIGGYFQMGICYSRMGNSKKAVDIFKDIIDTYPASRYAQKARTQLDVEDIIKK